MMGGGLFPLCLSLILLSCSLNKASNFCRSSKGVKISSLWGGLYQLATKCAVLLANTFTQTDSDLFSNSVIRMCGPQIVAIQEIKIDSFISSTELFPETFPYSMYRKDRTLDGGGVLLIHKDIPHVLLIHKDIPQFMFWGISTLEILFGRTDTINVGHH